MWLADAVGVPRPLHRSHRQRAGTSPPRLVSLGAVILQSRGLLEMAVFIVHRLSSCPDWHVGMFPADCDPTVVFLVPRGPLVCGLLMARLGSLIGTEAVASSLRCYLYCRWDHPARQLSALDLIPLKGYPSPRSMHALQTRQISHVSNLDSDKLLGCDGDCIWRSQGHTHT